MKTDNQLVVSIITDAIMWRRFTDKLMEMHKIFNPKCNEAVDFEPEEKYTGYTNAFKVLNVNHNAELCGALGDFFWNLAHENQTMNAHELAQMIYVEWLVAIKDFCFTQNQVA